MQILKKVLIVQATYNMKTAKQTISSLSFCQFAAGMLAEGKSLFGMICLSLSMPPARL